MIYRNTYHWVPCIEPGPIKGDFDTTPDTPAPTKDMTPGNMEAWKCRQQNAYWLIMRLSGRSTSASTVALEQMKALRYLVNYWRNEIVVDSIYKGVDGIRT